MFEPKRAHVSRMTASDAQAEHWRTKRENRQRMSGPARTFDTAATSSTRELGHTPKKQRKRSYLRRYQARAPSEQIAGSASPRRCTASRSPNQARQNASRCLKCAGCGRATCSAAAWPRSSSRSSSSPTKRGRHALVLRRKWLFLLFLTLTVTREAPNFSYSSSPLLGAQAL